MKTAIVLGSTGLIGSHLLQLLLDDNRYSTVTTFVRRSAGISNPKLKEHVVNFDEINSWKDLITGDELYSALGTTLKKAGSKEAQHKVDYSYQYLAAKFAAQNGVKKYLLVSSSGANAKSSNFYLKMKGQLDDDVSNLNFKNVIIFRPSLLVGEREEKRFGETAAAPVMNFFTYTIPFLKKYKPIEGKKVAESMIRAANTIIPQKVMNYTLDEI